MYSQIWKRVEKLLEIELDSEPVYGDDDKYIIYIYIYYIYIYILYIYIWWYDYKLFSEQKNA